MHRYAAKRYDDHGRHTGPGPWLDLIHATNALEPGSFGQPDSIGTDDAGVYREEYAGFTVVMRPRGNLVDVVGKTPEAEALLDRAAQTLPVTS